MILNRGLNINVELYLGGDGVHLYLAEENSSGCDYKVNNITDIGNLVKDYILNQGVLEDYDEEV